MKPKRALLTVGNMDGSLTISNVALSEAAGFAHGISDVTRSAIDDYLRWLNRPYREAGDYCEISDDTGDVVALVVLL